MAIVDKFETSIFKNVGKSFSSPGGRHEEGGRTKKLPLTFVEDLPRPDISNSQGISLENIERPDISIPPPPQLLPVPGIQVRPKTDISELWNQSKQSIYNRFSVQDKSGQPYLYNFPGEGVRSEGRGFPIKSTLRDAERIGKFTISDRGGRFLAKQFFLQSLNPTLETKVYNPLSLISSAPFVHIDRHASVASAAKLLNVLTLGVFSKTLSTVANLDRYEGSIKAIPFPPKAGGSRVVHQSPYASDINQELPGVKMANKGRSIILEAFERHNPNRYLFPYGADGAGLPLSSRYSPREEAHLKRNFVLDGTKFTQATGFNQPGDLVTTSVRSALTGFLRSLIPEPVRRPIASILGILGVDAHLAKDITIFNSYNVTFKYAPNLGKDSTNFKREVQVLNEARDAKFTLDEGSSPNAEILKALSSMSSTAGGVPLLKKGMPNVPYSFETKTGLQGKDLKVSTDIVKDKIKKAVKFPLTSTESPKKADKYLQSYGEIVAKRRSKEKGNLIADTTNSKGLPKEQRLPYGQQKREDDKTLETTYGFPNAGSTEDKDKRDKISLLDVGQEPADATLQELVPFRFYHVNPPSDSSGNLNHWLLFRAYLSGISENISSQWNSYRYIGRADQVYNYVGGERQLAFNFDIHPLSAQELAPLYRKLNRLVGMCWPNYIGLSSDTGGTPIGQFMVGPFVKLTIGDLYKDLPGIITSLSVSYDDNGTWETLRGLVDNVERAILPRYIHVAVSFTIIGKELFRSGAQFFDHEQGFKARGSNNAGLVKENVSGVV